MPWTSRTLFGFNTLAGAVCTDAAQLRNSPSLLTPRRTFPLLDSSDSADQFMSIMSIHSFMSNRVREIT